MCRYMGLNAFGTDNFLRGAIRARLLHLRRDDQLINTEGVDELSVSELQAACQSRGIRTTGISPSRLRDELSMWISLHLHNRVSGVLLILGRAFNFDRKPGDDEDGKTAVIKSLESVLSGLPDNLVRFVICFFGFHMLMRPFSFTSSMRLNWKLIQRKPATSRNLRYYNNNKNSSTTKRSKNRRKKTRVVPSEKRPNWKLKLRNPYFQTPRFVFFFPISNFYGFDHLNILSSCRSQLKLATMLV